MLQVLTTYWNYFQVRKLELDILPLQEANAELSEKSGMLQAEKKLLEEDVKRWKARNQVRELKPILNHGKMIILNNRVKFKGIKMFDELVKSIMYLSVKV